jgi:hypothetical protein
MNDRTKETVTIPLEVARLIRQAFVPQNPNKMRKVRPDVVAAAKTFIAAVEQSNAQKTL